MVKEQNYQIIITSRAEQSYFEVLDYVFEHHTFEQAKKISLELIDYPQVLKKFPNLGNIESNLIGRPEKFRFLLYCRTKKTSVKIIYFVDDWNKRVFIIDYFPCENHEQKIINKR
ncbi:MAG: hypothetical protein HYU67_08815 [Flavobacteriia bacterium]|nr:hypothetical protein [Flavobacteriia bacterium]